MRRLEKRNWEVKQVAICMEVERLWKRLGGHGKAFGDSTVKLAYSEGVVARDEQRDETDTGAKKQKRKRR
ncbi:unnamed protein product [Allacma fusca]|uniref:Uncharacterized protein n=1 Tax=Allacma fusca TaxID=39272 RepID=A0A8J2LGD1_9HEXA|nr:unnamed protein product [Allacma fusca]